MDAGKKDLEQSEGDQLNTPKKKDVARRRRQQAKRATARHVNWLIDHFQAKTMHHTLQPTPGAKGQASTHAAAGMLTVLEDMIMKASKILDQLRAEGQQPPQQLGFDSGGNTVEKDEKEEKEKEKGDELREMHARNARLAATWNEYQEFKLDQAVVELQRRCETARLDSTWTFSFLALMEHIEGIPKRTEEHAQYVIEDWSDRPGGEAWYYATKGCMQTYNPEDPILYVEVLKTMLPQFLEKIEHAFGAKQCEWVKGTWKICMTNKASVLKKAAKTAG